MGRLGSCLLLAALLAALACRGGEGPASTASAPGGSSGTPEAVAEAFLRLWQEGRYQEMHDFLGSEAQAALDREGFAERYRAIAQEATISGLRARRLPGRLGDPGAAEPKAGRLLPFAVTFTTALFGDISQENALPLVQEPLPTGKGWRVAWAPSLILKELKDGALLHRFVELPRRGSIYDRQGRPLAQDVPLPTVGVVPERLADAEATARQLAPLLRLSLDEVRDKMATEAPPYYFVPIATLPADAPPQLIDRLYAIPGVVLRYDSKRVYPQGPLAAHVLGHLAEVSPEQLGELASRGYQPGDKVGAAGIEGLFEDDLAGERGGALAVVNAQGEVLQVLARRQPRPGHDVYLTIDVDVQRWAQEGLRRRGSVVAMDPQDNSILAMASYPSFDPNAFSLGLRPEAWRRLAEDSRLPLLNRAAAAAYPIGSTFKAVTAAAGLERGGLTAASRLPCPPLWVGLGPRFAMGNWQKVDRGMLTVAQGLMASCNPVFYEIALRLDRIDPDILPAMARAFGLGQPTGVMGLEESAGVVPDRRWKQERLGEPWYTGDSVNMAIGQGYILATPLQVANIYSAITTGLLRTPLLVQRVVAADGQGVKEFQAQERGRLPVSPGTLAVIRDGLWKVINDPGGSAYGAFRGSPLVFAGKSGTAEDLAMGQDHVLFVAYAPSGEPRALAAVVLEEGTSGSVEAAPIVRRVIERLLAPSPAQAARGPAAPGGQP